MHMFIFSGFDVCACIFIMSKTHIISDLNCFNKKWMNQVVPAYVVFYVTI